MDKFHISKTKKTLNVGKLNADGDKQNTRYTITFTKRLYIQFGIEKSLINKKINNTFNLFTTFDPQVSVALELLSTKSCNDFATFFYPQDPEPVLPYLHVKTILVCMTQLNPI